MDTVRAKDIVGVHRLQYHELSNDAAKRARQAVINAEIRGFERELAAAEIRAETNIHSAINKAGRIDGLMHRKWIIRKMQTDKDWLERMIEGNLMHFLNDGTYVRYM